MKNWFNFKNAKNDYSLSYNIEIFINAFIWIFDGTKS